MEIGSLNVLTFTVDSHRVRMSTADPHSQWFWGRHQIGEHHEDGVSQHWLSHVRPDSQVLDIGCHAGWYTCLTIVAARSAKVAAFEIDSRLLRLCRKNLRLNKANNAVLVKAAVTDVDRGTALCRLEESPSATASLAPRYGDSTGRIEPVSAITVDGWCERHCFAPSLVKLDVEGSEAQVLAGMTCTLRWRCPTLFLELHSDRLPMFGSTFTDLHETLKCLGYRLYEVQKVRSHDGRTSVRKIGRGSNLTSRNPMILGVPGRHQIP